MRTDTRISSRLKAGLAVAGAIGAGVAVIKALFHDDRPTIRVRNGGSIHVETDDGEFVVDGGEWRQRAPGTKGPRTLEVCISHSGGTTCLDGRFVLIVYLVGEAERRLVVTAQKRYFDLFSDHVYVAPGTDAAVAHHGAALVLEPNQMTRLLRVAVGKKAGDRALRTINVPDEIAIHPRH
jgi:hypothetical protein